MRDRLRHVRLLTRQFLARFLDNDLVSAAEDLRSAAATLLSGLAISCATVALMFLIKYNPRFVEQTLDEKLAMALDDKTLLLAGAMILMGLVTTLQWEALSLDERDGKVLGPLPIHPLTMLAAKTAAVGGAAIACALVIIALPALLFPLVMLARAKVGLLFFAQSMAALALSGFAACLFTFLALLALRGALLAVLPQRWSPPVVRLLQFVLVVALLVGLVVLPLAVMLTRPAVEASSPWLRAWPPLWFLGLEEVLIGRREPVFPGLAWTGLFALAAALGAAGLVHLAGYARWRRRGSSFGAGHRPLNERTLWAGLVRRLGAFFVRDDTARASYFFTIQTLTRSPLHRLLVNGYLGLGLGLATGLVALAQSRMTILTRRPMDVDWTALSAQTALIFFLIAGVRVAATFPAGLKEAWLFRLLAMPALDRHLAGTKFAVLVLGVLPIVLALVPLHVLLVGWYGALVHAACGIVLALLLFDAAFLRFDRLPFVSPHKPGGMVLALRVPLYGLAYAFLTSVFTAFEVALVTHSGLAVVWVALVVAALRSLLKAVSPGYRPARTPSFDEGETVEQLGIGQAAFGEQRPEEGFVGRPPDPAALPATRPTLLRETTPPARSADGPDGNGWPWRRSTLLSAGAHLDTLGRGVRFACRRLVAAPVFTAFSILTLAIAFGATLVVYAVVEAFVLRPAAIGDITNVVNIYHDDPEGGRVHTMCLSLPDYRDLGDAQTSFMEMFAYSGFRNVVVGSGGGEFVSGEYVGGEYFRLLRITPALGRAIQPEDDQPGAAPVLVLSERIWRTRFAGDPAIVGRTVRLGDGSFQVVGVAPAWFRGLSMPKVTATDVWVPLHAALTRERERFEDREARWLLAKARLKPGRTIAQARAEVEAIGRGLDQSHPIGRDVPLHYRGLYYDSRRAWQVRPASSVLVHESVDDTVRSLSRLAILAVLLVLLVACTNLANLTLARGAARRQELAIRLALGASRARLVGEQAFESALLTAMGVCAGASVARLLMAYLVTAGVRVSPTDVIRVAPSFTLPVLLAAIGAAALAFIVFGIAPAVQLARTCVQSTLSSGTPGAAPTWRGRRVLIACQVAVSVALVGSAALATQQILRTAAARQTTVVLDRLAALRMDFAMQGWDEARGRETARTLLEQARRIRGIESAALASSLPAGTITRSAGVTTPDRPFVTGERGYHMGLVAASPGAFRVMGLRLVRGRAFDDGDGAHASRVAVLSELAVHQLFGQSDPIGRQVLVRSGGADAPEEAPTVIGIAADATGANTRGTPEGVVYLPFEQHYEPRMLLMARTPHDPATLVANLRSAAELAVPELAVLDAATGTVLVSSASGPLKVVAGAAGTLGLLALVLAMVGLYGVLSFVVHGRAREMGIRLALGASRNRIVRLVLADAVRPVIAGLVFGLTLAELAAIAVQSRLSRYTASFDPVLYTLVPLLFLAAALVASYGPARRAARVDPNEALKRV